jgi:ribose transport system permease protein
MSVSSSWCAAALVQRHSRFKIARSKSCSACAAPAGPLLAGFSAKARQGKEDALLPPATAALVMGGTRTLGGKGSHAGTVFGAGCRL